MLGQRASSLSGIAGVSHGFFGRVGGTSPQPWSGLNTSYTVMDSPARVNENLARIRFQIGLAPTALLAPHQVHGCEIVEVTDEDSIDQIKADAVFTTRKDIGIAVRTADCAPILLSDKNARFVAAIHAGWRGAVADIMGASVRAIGLRLDVPTTDMVAAIGPGIGKEQFQVGREVLDAAAQLMPAEQFYYKQTEDKGFFDLRGFIQKRLEELGIPHVEQVPGCTYSDTDTYFSHRNEQGNTGRQMSVIALCDAPGPVQEQMELPEPII